MKENLDVPKWGLVATLSEFSKDIEVDIYRKRFIVRNWLMQLWRLRNPTICCLQVKDPGNLGCNSYLNLIIWQLREPMCKPQYKDRKRLMSQLKQANRKEKEKIPSFFTFLFYPDPEQVG